MPRAETFSLLPSGRLNRDGVELEMNAYCRRAVSKGVELARSSGGTCTVFTLGPPSAEDALREAVAWGADEGVLVTDPAFAGSDTLATARAMASCDESEGPFDLVMLGRNSIDADTGQVPPEVAELLDLPFAGGVKEIVHLRGSDRGRCELDDGWKVWACGCPRSCQLPSACASRRRWIRRAGRPWTREGSAGSERPTWGAGLSARPVALPGWAMSG